MTALEILGTPVASRWLFSRGVIADTDNEVW